MLIHKLLGRLIKISQKQRATLALGLVEAETRRIYYNLSL
jgi:hypothetical protein